MIIYTHENTQFASYRVVRMFQIWYYYSNVFRGNLLVTSVPEEFPNVTEMRWLDYLYWFLHLQ